MLLPIGVSNMLQRPSNFGKISAFESSKSPLRAKRRPVMKCRPGPLPIPVVVRPKKTPLPLANSWPVGDVPSANSCASPMWKPIASTTTCCASANAVKSRRAPIKTTCWPPSVVCWSTMCSRSVPPNTLPPIAAHAPSNDSTICSKAALPAESEKCVTTLHASV